MSCIDDLDKRSISSSTNRRRECDQ